MLNFSTTINYNMAGQLNISEKEKEIARAAWAQVEKTYDPVGHVLFKELFIAVPHHADWFTKMKSSPSQDLFESPRFQQHAAANIAPDISQMLKNLDKPDQLAAQLREIGGNHKPRSLSRVDFEAVQKTTLGMIKKVMGSQFTPQTEAAWNKFFTIVVDKITAEL